MKRNIYIVSILIIFFLAFYVQDRYAIYSVDDWIYAFEVNENAHNYQSVAEDNTDRQMIPFIPSCSFIPNTRLFQN